MLPLDQYVGGNHQPTVWRGNHSGVIAGTEQACRPDREPSRDPFDQPELAKLRQAHRLLPSLPTRWSARRPAATWCGIFTDIQQAPASRRWVVVQAYILIQTEVGRARDVATAIGDVPGVVRVDAITGPYDVIVLSEAHSVDELGKMIVTKVQAIPGITRTLTCSVVRL
jgi:DNA-binding Lrp family transcriptional regulator